MTRLALALLIALSALLAGQSPCSAGYCAGACTNFCAGPGCFCVHNGPNAPGHCVGHSEREAAGRTLLP